MKVIKRRKEIMFTEICLRSALHCGFPGPVVTQSHNGLISRGSSSYFQANDLLQFPLQKYYGNMNKTMFQPSMI